MKKPPVERFDASLKKEPSPEEIDISGVPEIKKHPGNQASEQESNQASTLASKRASTDPEDHVIERIRKVVKDTGRDTAYIRFTEEEKDQLSRVVYSMKRKDFKTSENEILRIAVRVLLEDHQAQGENSTLIKVLEALNS